MKKTNQEILNKIEKDLTYYWYIGETLVDLSKCHISKDTALKQIKDYMWTADDITFKDLDQIKESLKVLELIKNHIIVDSVGNVLIRSISKENEQKILKEWIKNDY